MPLDDLQPSMQRESGQPGQELVQSSTRQLIFATGALWIIWHFIAPLSLPMAALYHVWVATSVVVASSLLALWALSRWPLPAQCCWLLGLTTALTLVIYRFQ